MYKFLAVSCLAVLAQAQDIPTKLKYPEMTKAMTEWGYKWSAHEMETEDGFTLTTFRIEEKIGYDIPRDESLMPVVVMHGTHSDGVTWVDWPVDRGSKPMVFHLFEDGFDVWLAANRGTRYCQKHNKYTMDQQEYWAWTFAEMGLYDDTINIKYIKEYTSKEKVSYLGMSQGTVQMFYALSHIEDSFLADNLYTFAALSPCTHCESEGPDNMFYDGYFKMEENGIYALGAVNWEENLQWICDNMPAETCDNAGYYTGGQPVSVRTECHWAQSEIANRLQEYSPSFVTDGPYTDLVPLWSIDKVPITMYSGLLDRTCPHTTAMETKRIIGERVQDLVTCPWCEHYWWGGRASYYIYVQLRENLRNPENKSFDSDYFYFDQEVLF